MLHPDLEGSPSGRWPSPARFVAPTPEHHQYSADQKPADLRWRTLWEELLMNERTKAGRVLQMRLVVEAPDYEDAVVFYRDVLGAPEELVVEGNQG